MTQVSIGVPVYNGDKYLAETLDSLLAQTFEDFELVITDNASTDGTAAICRSYQARDRRVRYFRNERNLGAALNFNRAFELSSAPLFHCAACDDVYEPHFLERCVDVLDRCPGVVLSHTDTRFIGDDGEPLRHDSARNCFADRWGEHVMGPEPYDIGGAAEPEVRFRQVLWLLTWCFPISGVIRRKALLRTSLHRSYYGGDKALLAELALQGRFHQVRESLFVKRVHRGCSYRKSIRAKAEHDSTAPPRGISHLKVLQDCARLRDYIIMALGADIGLPRKLHCMLTVAGMTRRRAMWRRLLTPAPATPPPTASSTTPDRIEARSL